ncbi:thiamine-phosphate kinase [Thiomicrorhabdus arctica]|jgi:thiamine-monophosphate kinase|uniref:thiamine-phosphate kinase n=1 Tax=Thiomicrorhabdus arctica TaxID=131540 RepID=UPI00036A4D21|nr:thiamine-phosphate kinase [Thiomicrorhabdus arctica]
MALEFDLIETYFKPLSQSLSGEEVGIGDDGAVLSVPENHQMVVVTDTLVSGVHFPLETAAYDIAWKAVAVNLSDLAAMGASPGGYSLGLTLPDHDQAWLKDFSSGLEAITKQFKIPLIGGDTTKGPLTLTVTAHGWVPNQQAILRSGAQVGDLICVTETIGDGALGLKLALHQLDKEFTSGLNEIEKQALLSALNHPVPQLAIAADLRGLVNSAIDISDGLLADLGHILEQASGKQSRLSAGLILELGAEIELTKLPLSSAVEKYIAQTHDWSPVLSGGDDYQLCMTFNQNNWPQLQQMAQQHGVRITQIGRVVEQEGIHCLMSGKPVADEFVRATGYSHF